MVSPVDSSNEDETLHSLTALLRQSLAGFFLIHQQQGSSQRYWIEETLRRWCDEEEIDLIVTVGGTFPAPGPSAAEIVPEATNSVIERPLPSVPETMRAYALEEDPSAILDRGVAGIRGRTLMINLPAGPRLTLLFLDAIIDLLPLILGHLQPEQEADVTSTEEQSRSSTADVYPPKSSELDHKLNADEFADFLQKRRDLKGRIG